MELSAKLQLRVGQRLVVAASPSSPHIDGAIDTQPYSSDAVMVFVENRAQLDARTALIVACASVDQLTWVGYPKAGQLGTDLNRDSLASILTGHGLRAVRQVAIDSVWSSQRFRPGDTS